MTPQERKGGGPFHRRSGLSTWVRDSPRRGMSNASRGPARHERSQRCSNGRRTRRSWRASPAACRRAAGFQRSSEPQAGQRSEKRAGQENDCPGAKIVRNQKDQNMKQPSLEHGAKGILSKTSAHPLHKNMSAQCLLFSFDKKRSCKNSRNRFCKQENRVGEPFRNKAIVSEKDRSGKRSGTGKPLRKQDTIQEKQSLLKGTAKWLHMLGIFPVFHNNEQGCKECLRSWHGKRIICNPNDFSFSSSQNAQVSTIWSSHCQFSKGIYTTRHVNLSHQKGKVCLSEMFFF